MNVLVYLHYGHNDIFLIIYYWYLCYSVCAHSMEFYYMQARVLVPYLILFAHQIVKYLRELNDFYVNTPLIQQSWSKMAHFHVRILKKRNKSVKEKRVLRALGPGIFSASLCHFGSLVQGLLHNMAVFSEGNPSMLLMSLRLT